MGKENNKPQGNPNVSTLRDMVNPVKELPLGDATVKVSALTLADLMELGDIYPELDIMNMASFITDMNDNAIEQLKLFSTFIWFGVRKNQPELSDVESCYDLLSVNIFLNEDEMLKLLDIISAVTTVELTRTTDEDEPPPPESDGTDPQQKSAEGN